MHSTSSATPPNKVLRLERILIRHNSRTVLFLCKLISGLDTHSALVGHAGLDPVSAIAICFSARDARFFFQDTRSKASFLRTHQNKKTCYAGRGRFAEREGFPSDIPVGGGSNLPLSSRGSLFHLGEPFRKQASYVLTPIKKPAAQGAAGLRRGRDSNPRYPV